LCNNNSRRRGRKNQREVAGDVAGLHVGRSRHLQDLNAYISRTTSRTAKEGTDNLQDLALHLHLKVNLNAYISNPTTPCSSQCQACHRECRGWFQACRRQECPVCRRCQECHQACQECLLAGGCQECHQACQGCHRECRGCLQECRECPQECRGCPQECQE